MDLKTALQQAKKEYPFPEVFREQRYENIINHIVKRIPAGAKVLDLGAGPCEIPAILSLMGYNCTAYDDFMDEWLTKNNGRQKVFDFAKKMNVRVELVDYKTIPFEKGEFDLFMMNDVLEHLHDSPRDLLNDCLEKVREEGYLFITVPSVVNIRKRISVLLGKTNLPDYETYYWYPGKWRGPVREYTRGDLTQMCEYLNLNIVELKATHHMLERVPNKYLGIYKLITKIFPDWKDSWILMAQKPKGWKPKKTISEEAFGKIMKKTQKEHRKNEKLF